MVVLIWLLLRYLCSYMRKSWSHRYESAVRPVQVLPVVEMDVMALLLRYRHALDMRHRILQINKSS